jgi:hypothetical protein
MPACHASLLVWKQSAVLPCAALKQLLDNARSLAYNPTVVKLVL